METTASIFAITQLCDKVIKYINAVHGAKNDRQRLRSQIRACSIILLQLRDSFEDVEEREAWAGTMQAVAAPLTRLREVLQLAATQLQLKDRTKDKLLWPFKEKDMRKLMEAIEYEKSLLALALENNATKLLIQVNLRLEANTAHLEDLRVVFEQSSQKHRLESQAINEKLLAVHARQNDLLNDIQEIRSFQDDRMLLSQRKEIMGRLSTIDDASHQMNALSKQQSGTGQWFLNSAAYQHFFTTPGQTLFCPGIPGAGKTTLVATIIDDLRNRYHDDKDIGITFVYFDYSRRDEQSTGDLLASLLKQLVERRSGIPLAVERLYEKYIQDDQKPPRKGILEAIRSVAISMSHIFIVVDALDECSDVDGRRTQFFQNLKFIQEWCQVNLLATSRFIPDIMEYFEDVPYLEIHASCEDVLLYLDAQMYRLPRFVLRNTSLQEEIKSRLVESIQGMQVSIPSLIDYC